MSELPPTGPTGQPPRDRPPAGQAPAGQPAASPYPSARRQAAAGGRDAGRVRRHRTGGGVARVPIVAAVAAALLACGLADSAAGGSSTPPGATAAAVQEVPVAAPATALSSSWFCGGTTDDAGGQAPGSVVIANSGLTAASGVVTLLPSSGPSVQRPVSVGPDSRQVVSEDVPGGAHWMAAIVDVDAGAVSVEQYVNGPGGVDTAPCATSGSAHWYFASGQTLVNAGVEITLVNPYPADSVVDLSFTTDQGLESPVEYQGIVVPARGMIALNLGDHLRRRQQIATTVTARTGRVIAWKTQWVTSPPSGHPLLGTPGAQNPLSDPAAPVSGVSLALGAPSAGTNWVWADGQAGNGVTEQYVIYNPGPVTADVRLAVDLDQGVAEPFDLSVPPDQVIPVESDQQARIPAGVTHSAVLQSTNGVPVVAERVVTATSPSAWSGIGDMLGARVPAQRWLLGAAVADPAHDGWVVLFNPGTEPAVAVVDAVSAGSQVPLAGLSPVTVPPGHRVALQIGKVPSAGGDAIVVTSPVPLYAEYDVYGVGTPGVGLSSGVPLS